jgi:hypothetical protein
MWRHKPSYQGVTTQKTAQNFYYGRFGAIWCDLVRSAALSSILLRQGYGGQGFKDQSGAGKGKNCRFGPPSDPIKPRWKHFSSLIDFD